MNEKIKMIAPCIFGIESIAANEFKRMGFEDVVTENGRVLLSGDYNMLARANINSRFAERILINMGQFMTHQLINILVAPLLQHSQAQMKPKNILDIWNTKICIWSH